MSNYLPQESESEGVNPMDDDNVDAQDHSIYRLVCFSAAPLPPAPHYQDEPFIQGQQQIGLGNCAICCNAPNNCFLVSRAQGLPSCGHAICSTCAAHIMTKEARVCPFCRQYIGTYILVDFA